MNQKKSYPTPRKIKGGTDHRVASQTVHLVAVSGFDNAHTEHVQVPVFADGAFTPAAAQSKPFAAGWTGAESLLSVPQIAHLSFASAVLVHMHVSHFQLPPDGAVGGSMPAAPQLNPLLLEVEALMGLEKSYVGSEAIAFPFTTSCAGLTDLLADGEGNVKVGSSITAIKPTNCFGSVTAMVLIEPEAGNCAGENLGAGGAVKEVAEAGAGDGSTFSA